MNSELLQHALGSRPVHYFASTESTMRDAQNWLDEEPALPSGAVVIADEQRQGRGRLGRGWLTPAGSAIAMSLILRAEYPPQQMTILGAMGVAETLDQLLPNQIALKWPNDVLLNGKKVCGVLAESVWEGNRLLASVIGIGINVAVDFAGSPLEHTATSLTHHLAQPVDRVQLIAGVLGRIDQWLAILQTHFAGPFAALTPSPLYTAWKARLVTLGKPIQLQTDETTLSGIALDVDADGALLVQLSDGSLRRYLAGDVSLSAS
jgi:BirA family biotin operon repressor/biotin-[acetyl-CoA-carboxylase] ligase